ncbi:MAG: hypothetical protein OEV78_08340 [Spirochaetia bacterium]|nr:hypothetical protein [Spirochaetia bacterium]
MEKEKKAMFSKKKLPELAAVVVVGIIFSYMIYHKFPEHKKYTNKYPKLISSQSGIFVNNTPTREGSKVRPGDILESDGESYRIMLSESIVLDVQFKSRLRFYEEKGITYVDLQEGALAAVINSEKKTNPLIFKTPTGNIIDKGTVFFVKVISPNETYFCICHGEVELLTKSASKTVKADHHSGYSMIRTNTIENIVPDKMKYHQDPLLEEMAKNVKYHISWE